MIFRIRHTTRFVYDEPAYESHNEVRLTPRASAGQRCLAHEVRVSPAGGLLAYNDSFGNRVHAISVHPPHDELAIVAESVVERDAPRPARPVRVPFSEFLGEDDARMKEHFEFLNPSPFVPFSDRLRKFFWSTRPGHNETVDEYAARVIRWIRDQFEYERGKTHVHSGVDDILDAGGGVCQDFAHLTIGLMRMAGVPARYVSGYLAPRVPTDEDGPLDPEVALGEQASHAWIEVLLPGVGWTGFDPTHRGRTTDHHLRIAVGRDYGDVPPLRGVYRSAGGENHMTVELAIESSDSGEGSRNQ
jgi:transglutaminase-like putative cysteine protease